MREGSFDERLGGAAKVDCLVKFDVETLIARGQARTQGLRDPVDPRSVVGILADQERGETRSTLEVFALPLGWYAQEPRFVAREGDSLEEDDGFLMTYGEYAFDLADVSLRRVVHRLSRCRVERAWFWFGAVDYRRKAHGSRDGRRSLSNQTSSAGAVRVSDDDDNADISLHGTYIPASDAATQCPLFDVPPQTLLQEKLHQSRLAYFFDIVFHRPSVRDKSKAEQVVLALLWPLAWVALIVAVAEAVRMSGFGSVDGSGFRFGGNETN